MKTIVSFILLFTVALSAIQAQTTESIDAIVSKINRSSDKWPVSYEIDLEMSEYAEYSDYENEWIADGFYEGKIFENGYAKIEWHYEDGANNSGRHYTAYFSDNQLIYIQGYHAIRGLSTKERIYYRDNDIPFWYEDSFSDIADPERDEITIKHEGEIEFDSQKDLDYLLKLYELILEFPKNY